MSKNAFTFNFRIQNPTQKYFPGYVCIVKTGLFLAGESNKLKLQGPLYVGGLDSTLEDYLLPPSLWSATLRKGFVGCFRDFVANGFSINIAQHAKKQDSGN